MTFSAHWDGVTAPPTLLTCFHLQWPKMNLSALLDNVPFSSFVLCIESECSFICSFVYLSNRYLLNIYFVHNAAFVPPLPPMVTLSYAGLTHPHHSAAATSAVRTNCVLWPYHLQRVYKEEALTSFPNLRVCRKQWEKVGGLSCTNW